MSSRLPSVKPKEFLRKLRRAGFYIDHQTGSHITLLDNSGHRVIVPYHVREMKRGLVFGLLKQAGLSVDKFNKL